MIRGLRSAEPLAKKFLAHKAEILALLKLDRAELLDALRKERDRLGARLDKGCDFLSALT